MLASWSNCMSRIKGGIRVEHATAADSISHYGRKGNGNKGLQDRLG